MVYPGGKQLGCMLASKWYEAQNQPKRTRQYTFGKTDPTLRSTKVSRPGEEIEGPELTSVMYKQVVKQIRRLVKVRNLLLSNCES